MRIKLIDQTYHIFLESLNKVYNWMVRYLQAYLDLVKQLLTKLSGEHAALSGVEPIIPPEKFLEESLLGNIHLIMQKENSLHVYPGVLVFICSL